jgi:hypothetical protein
MAKVEQSKAIVEDFNMIHQVLVATSDFERLGFKQEEIGRDLLDIELPQNLCVLLLCERI